jgi:hypothetical protein
MSLPTNLALAGLLSLAGCANLDGGASDEAALERDNAPTSCVTGSNGKKQLGCDPQDKKKTTICHLPPGNPANEHTLCIGNPAVPAHLAHGDYLGPCNSAPTCGDDGGTPPPPPSVDLGGAPPPPPVDAGDGDQGYAIQ